MKFLKYLGLSALFSKTALRMLLTLLAPLALITVIVYVFTFLMSFIFWQLPEYWYFPFTDEREIVRMLDRMFLLAGIIFVFIDPFKENDYYVEDVD